MAYMQSHTAEEHEGTGGGIDVVTCGNILLILNI